MDFLIVILFGVALIWLFIVLPQRRRQSTHQKMLDALKTGDEVLTAGGIYGYVTELAQEEIAIEVADGVELRIAKQAVASIVPPEEDEDEANVDDELVEHPVEEAAEEPASAEEPEPTPEQRG